VPLPTERYEAMVRALEPLPTFEPATKAGLPPQRVEVQPQHVIQLDVNSDGSFETALVFLIRPFYGDPMYDAGINGKLGLALFDADNRLLWRTNQDVDLQDRAALDVTAMPIQLAPGEMGLLYYFYTICRCSGIWPEGQFTLYRWDGRTLQEVWQRFTDSGARAGWCCSSYMKETVWPRDVDGDGRVEILLEHNAHVQDLEYAPHAYSYHLVWPGSLALRWNGTTYAPAYFVNDGQVMPIRSRFPVMFAPRLSYSLTMDGNQDDWSQLEYSQPYDLDVGPNEYSVRPRPKFAWDAAKLYLTMTVVSSSQALMLTIDTDLQGDLRQASLDSDDIVMELTLSTGLNCQGVATVGFRYPAQDVSRIEAAVGQTWDGSCAVEMSIPFDLLDLDGNSLVSAPGWVVGGLKPEEGREYHPRAGRLIGFAIALDGQASSPDFRWDDPTTWNTLVFMADR
jgi:hypothetical protein